MARVNITVGPSLLLVPVALYAGYKLYQSGKAIRQAGADFYGQYSGEINTVNPASDQNFIYQGYNWWAQKLSGDQNATLGTWLYDLFNDDPQI